MEKERQAWINSVTLHGNLVSLLPMTREHREDLLKAASDGKLWELWYTSVPSESEIDTYMEIALRGKENGDMYPLVIYHKAEDRIIGSTRYCNIAAEHRRLEIGYTWYAGSFQRTGVNTESKYLLLKYAFDHLNCGCVQFRTHFHNRPSRKAIERIGARLDGILRNDRLNADGSYRDTVVYSILDSEWPVVRRSLEFEMNRDRT